MVTGYEIWIGGYFHMSGGIRALHVLKQELLNRGLPAWMKYEKHDKNALAVYPEIVAGNPEGYERFVRWYLNYAPPTADQTFAWETGMGDYPLLTVDIIEPDLWTPRTERGRGVAYWVGKGAFDSRLVPSGAVQISRKNFPTREELAAFIKTLDYLISFDPFTAVNVEAVCAGVPVLIRGDDARWSRAKVEAHGWTPFGVAWSMEELPEARATVRLAYDHYQSLRQMFQQRIDDFVTATA